MISKTKLDIFENAFRKIKEATGVSDVNEVIQKIVNQEGTTENLLVLTKENQVRGGRGRAGRGCGLWLRRRLSDGRCGGGVVVPDEAGAAERHEEVAQVHGRGDQVQRVHGRTPQEAGG